MALRFVDSFDHYATADIVKKWSTVSSSPTISAGNGRRSTASLRIATGVVQYVGLNLTAQPTWILGFALRMGTVNSFNSQIMQWFDNASAQVELWMLTTGALSIVRAGSATLGTVTSPLLTAGTYNYIEWAVTIHPSAGTSELRINGTSVLSLTGVNTRATANSSANILRFGYPTGSGSIYTWDYDDVYICDGTGSAPHNTFLGDCRVDTLFPTSDGTSQQWTPSTAGTHYTLVDETAPNTTDYVASNTVGHRDTYGMQDLSAMTGTIYGVQLNLAALKNDAGARSVKPLLLSGASEALGAATALSTSQTYTLHMQTTDPATGVAWTESGVNAAQCGAEVA